MFFHLTIQFHGINFAESKQAGDSIELNDKRPNQN
jgi:hypothetical protein